MTDSLRSPLAQTHITFIGGGNMGRALIGGLLASGLSAKQITVVEPLTTTAEKLKADFSVAIVNLVKMKNTSKYCYKSIVKQLKRLFLENIRQTPSM